MAFSDTGLMLPAPPRPLLKRVEVWGRIPPKREAGPRAVAPEDVWPVLKVLPAPPRPECV